MGEPCPYCGRFMARLDYGIEFGEEWVCSRQFEHIVADPDHWTIGTLDKAVSVAKARAGLDPDAAALPATFIEHLDKEWRRPFWERQLDRVVEAAGVATSPSHDTDRSTE